MQCYNCYRFGHLAKYCKLKKKCRNCNSENHETDACQDDTQCINCKNYNERFNTNYDIHHSVRDQNCSIYESEILELRAGIDYGVNN